MLKGGKHKNDKSDKKFDLKHFCACIKFIQKILLTKKSDIS